MTSHDLAALDRPLAELEADVAERRRLKAMPIKEGVLGGLLAGLPDAPPEVAAQIGATLVRATLHLVPNPPEPLTDFEDSVEAGHTESLNAWADRVLGSAGDLL